jgi:hypothetical protein
VIGAGDFAVAQQGTPTMGVKVGPGRAVVRFGNASSLTAGASTIFNDADTNVALAAADPTNPRIDLVCIEIRSLTEYGQAANDARFFVIQGTPAASPAVPAVSAAPNCLVLAQVAVAAAAATIVNANITDKRTRAAAVGGIIVCTSTTRPTGASLAEGLFIYETDTNLLDYYDGATFRLPNTEAWTSVGALSGTWANVGAGAQIPRYRKVGDQVFIEGHVKSGTTGTTVFTLPVGYRPPLNMTFATDGSGAYAILSVSSAGVVVLTGTTGTTMSLNCNFSTV